MLILFSPALADAAEGTKLAAAGKTAKENVLLALVRAATYTVEASLTVFTRTFPENAVQSVDDKHVVPWTKSTVKSQASLMNDLTVKFALSAAYSGYDDELQGVFASPGLSTLYLPANRYQVMNTANPMHPDDLGAWQASLDYFLGDHTLRFSVLPFETRSPLPFGSSRWLGEFGGILSLSSTASTGLTGGVTGLTPPSGASAQTVFHNRLGSLLKFSGVLPSLDYFLTAHYGPSNFPTIQNPTGNEFVLETPAAVTCSGGFAATRGAWELHGESLYQLTDGDADQDFVRYVIGTMYRETRLAEWMGLQEIVPVVEYAGEVVTDEQDNPGVTVPSTKARPLRNALLFKVDIKPTDKLTGMVGRVQNISSHDYAQGVGLEYRPNYNLTLRLIAVVFGGRKDTAFGQWDRNDHVEFSVTRTF
ncbi:MAG: hypothetical protein HYZ89_05305 [Candidatus Omnitrophica bacterium]|nr:hypothetical protein [Candidatus Omnitrophota bacterium]